MPFLPPLLKPALIHSLHISSPPTLVAGGTTVDGADGEENDQVAGGTTVDGADSEENDRVAPLRYPLHLQCTWFKKLHINLHNFIFLNMGDLHVT